MWTEHIWRYLNIGSGNSLVTSGTNPLPELMLYQIYVAIHWNGKVFILMKCSSLAALEVVKMTTSSAASDENFVKMTTFLFQCMASLSHDEL